jgi:cytochrome c-type biogenesis protein CcmE
VDLTPAVDERPARQGNGRLRLVVVLGLIVVAVGFLLVQGLDSATVYFRNVDEAVRDREELGDRRFRMQGEVVEGSVREQGEAVEFVVAFGGEQATVLHRGDPPDLFQPGIPVVVEGRWDGDVFASDLIVVKHSSEYKAENPDRVDPEDP